MLSSDNGMGEGAIELWGWRSSGRTVRTVGNGAIGVHRGIRQESAILKGERRSTEFCRFII